MEQDITNSTPEQDPAPAPVKRGRGRPKGSKNKPKNELVASTDKPVSLEDKMVADGMDREAAAKANDEVHALLRKMFNIADNQYDTEDPREYNRRLNEMTKVQIQHEMSRRGRNPSHDTDRNIKILVDLFKEYWANRVASQVPVTQVKMTPEVEKIIKEWHGKVV